MCDTHQDSLTALQKMDIISGYATFEETAFSTSLSLELVGETLAHKSDLVPSTEPLHLGGWQTPAERHRAI